MDELLTIMVEVETKSCIYLDTLMNKVINMSMHKVFNALKQYLQNVPGSSFCRELTPNMKEEMKSIDMKYCLIRCFFQKIAMFMIIIASSIFK